MKNLYYQTGFYVYKNEAAIIICDPVVFLNESLNILVDINGYSLKDIKFFVNELKGLLAGNKIWNGDDYDLQWSGGEMTLFTSNEKHTTAVDAFSGKSIEISTVGIYELLLDRLRLMECYPAALIKRILLESESADLYLGVCERIELVNISHSYLCENIDLVKFDTNYYV